MKFLLVIVFFILSACSKGIEGIYEKTTFKKAEFGWKILEFKDGNLLLINGGEFKSKYRIEGSKIIMQAGILEVVGEIKGDQLIIDNEIFQKKGAKLINNLEDKKITSTTITADTFSYKSHKIGDSLSPSNNAFMNNIEEGLYREKIDSELIKTNKNNLNQVINSIIFSCKNPVNEIMISIGDYKNYMSNLCAEIKMKIDLKENWDPISTFKIKPKQLCSLAFSDDFFYFYGNFFIKISSYFKNAEMGLISQNSNAISYLTIPSDKLLECEGIEPKRIEYKINSKLDYEKDKLIKIELDKITKNKRWLEVISNGTYFTCDNNSRLIFLGGQVFVIKESAISNSFKIDSINEFSSQSNSSNYSWIYYNSWNRAGYFDDPIDNYYTRYSNYLNKNSNTLLIEVKDMGDKFKETKYEANFRYNCFKTNKLDIDAMRETLIGSEIKYQLRRSE